MEDTLLHKGMRRKLIEELREKGIKSEAVLIAFDQVPRHFFLDPAFIKQAYSNIAFPIGEQQTISHPYTVAFQTELLDIKKGDKVLEIGTGSGFQTAILCKVGARVISIERQSKLFKETNIRLKKLGFNANLIFGDGYKGRPATAPYDKILVTCGAPFIPEALLGQLKIGGILVIPVGEGEKQEMTRLTRVSETSFNKETFGDFSFVPMLERTNK